MPPVVKTEDSRAQSPPVPASCQPGKWTHSPSATSSQGSSGDTRGVQVPSWGPVAQGEAWGHLLKSSPVGFSAPPTRFCPPTEEGAGPGHGGGGRDHAVLLWQ